MTGLHVHRTPVTFVDGSVVEIGCLGGHGRTGTALACLAVLAGTPPAEAVAWVRVNYCEHAVETSEQEAFVRSQTVDD